MRKTFGEECAEKFRFLIDEYGCKIAGIEEGVHGVEIVFKNNTTGVKVGFEPRENDIFVRLIRLIDERYSGTSTLLRIGFTSTASCLF